MDDPKSLSRKEEVFRRLLAWSTGRSSFWHPAGILLPGVLKEEYDVGATDR